jgi:hypothetical protein
MFTMENAFSGNFNRLEGWSELGSVRATAKAGGETVWELCRQLLDLGHPDGALRMFDERKMHCYTIGSIHKGAKRALRQTDVPSGIYVGLRYVMMDAWLSVHAGTKQALLKRHYVEVDGDLATATEAGKAAIVEYEAVHGVQDISPPDPKERIEVVKLVREPREKKVVLTDKQMKAFVIAVKQPYKWDIVVSTKVAKMLVTAGWIVIANGFPKLTAEGTRVYETLNLQIEAIAS